MVIIQRQGVLLASALARGAPAVAGAWLVLLGNAASSTLADQLKPVAAPQSAALAPVQRVPCPVQPAAPVGGRKDGQFVLQTDLSSMTAGNIAPFIVLGKEAAASGRPRDAEVAFLMACRVADRLLGMDSVEAADAKYQMGRLYARLALEGDSASMHRTELRRRAERLYADSLRTYQARYGPAHEKTRFAAEGLAALSQTLSPAPGSSSMPSQQASLPTARSRQEAATLPTTPDLGAAALPGPSFDCAKAHSVVEKMICSDAELARLDRELGRLYARAKNAAADAAAFRRQTSEEWRMREATCRDRECLLRWYANRQDHLMNVLLEQEPAPSAVSR
jgi:hypothetical protein